MGCSPKSLNLSWSVISIRAAMSPMTQARRRAATDRHASTRSYNRFELHLQLSEVNDSVGGTAEAAPIPRRPRAHSDAHQGVQEEAPFRCHRCHPVPSGVDGACITASRAPDSRTIAEQLILFSKKICHDHNSACSLARVFQRNALKSRAGANF